MSFRISKDPPKWMEILPAFVVQSEGLSEGYQKRIEAFFAKAAHHWPNFVAKHAAPPKKKARKQRQAKDDMCDASAPGVANLQATDDDVDADEDIEESMRCRKQVQQMPPALKEALRREYGKMPATVEAGHPDAPRDLRPLDVPQEGDDVGQPWEDMDRYADVLYDTINAHIKKIGLDNAHPVVGGVDELYEVTKTAISRCTAGE